MLSSNISSTCPHNMVTFSLLAAEIVSLVWGTPANVNGFRVAASLLQRRSSTKANQTLHNVWPFASSKSCAILFARQSCSGRRAKLCGVEHLYSAGRPSRWALAHILVDFFLRLTVSAVEAPALKLHTFMSNLCYAASAISSLICASPKNLLKFPQSR